MRELALATGEKLPDEFNLLNLHIWLKKRGWSMPLDLLLRYPKRHQILDRLYKYEREKLYSDLNGHKNLCVYLIREDAISANATEQILKELKTHYRILDTVTFTQEQQTRVVRRTRGGNWTKHKHLRLYLPEIAVICQSLVPFEPVNDIKATRFGEKPKNPDIQFKHEMRKRLEQLFPEADDFVHGSDNDIESMEYIQAIYGDAEWKDKYNALFNTEN